MTALAVLAAAALFLWVVTAFVRALAVIEQAQQLTPESFDVHAERALRIVAGLDWTGGL